jgi:hypothetical protein
MGATQLTASRCLRPAQRACSIPGGATTQVRFTQTSSAGDVHGQGSAAYQQFSQTYHFTVSSSGRVMSVTNAGHFPSYLVPAAAR